MTEPIREEMTDEAVADLLTEAVESVVRFKPDGLESAMDRLFTEGTPADGLRFAIGAVTLVASMLSQAQASRAIQTGRAALLPGAPHVGQILYLRMLADVLLGDHHMAQERWLQALICDGSAGAPGYAIGAALRHAAMLVAASRAKLQ